jgi:hypothetical protein
MKLIKLHMVQVIGLVENEWCFFMLTFMKIKIKELTNLTLGANHSNA